MLTFQGLEELSFELTSFDMEEVKPQYIQVLSHHAGTLRHISLSKNKVPNSLMKDIAAGFSGNNVLEKIDLLHVKEARNI